MPDGADGPATEGLPPYCLAHLLNKRAADGDLLSRYELWPIKVPWPAHGRITAELTCGTCKRSYPCTLSSRARWLRQCRWGRAAGVALLVAALATLTVPSIIWQAWLFLSLLAPALMLVVLGYLWAGMPDLFIKHIKLSGDSRHSLREPGSTVSSGSYHYRHDDYA